MYGMTTQKLYKLRSNNVLFTDEKFDTKFKIYTK